MKDNIDSVLFEVEQVPLAFEDGVGNTPIYGLRRTDTNQFLGSCSDRYGITQNQNFIDVTESALKSAGFTDYNRSAIASGNNGSRCFVTYDINDELIQVGRQVGDVVGLRITLLNSFDKSLKRGFRVGLHRLVCSNGMVATEVDISIDDRHTINKVDLDQLTINDCVVKAKQHFQTAVSHYKKMVEINVSGKGDALFDKIVDRKAAPARVATKVKAIWESPTFKEDEERNLFNMLNAWTQFLDSPHSEYREKFFDTAQTTKNSVFRFFKGIDQDFINNL